MSDKNIHKESAKIHMEVATDMYDVLAKYKLYPADEISILENMKLSIFSAAMKADSMKSGGNQND
jgi:hypothetical protein